VEYLVPIVCGAVDGGQDAEEWRVDIWSEMDISCTVSKEEWALTEDGISLLPIIMLTCHITSRIGATAA